MKIEGKNAVRECINSGKTIEKIMLQNGVDAKDIIDSIRVVTSQESKPKIVGDYDVDVVGAKVVKIIMSYTGYINRTVWRKY